MVKSAFQFPDKTLLKHMWKIFWQRNVSLIPTSKPKFINDTPLDTGKTVHEKI